MKKIIGKVYFHKYLQVLSEFFLFAMNLNFEIISNHLILIIRNYRNNTVSKFAPPRLSNIPEKMNSDKKVLHYRYNNASKRSKLKSLTKKQKNKRQNSLLTIATGPSSRYYTTRQTDKNNTSVGKQIAIKFYRKITYIKAANNKAQR
jgi:hypothetical protein